jgi:hypothetical protein
MIVLSLEVGARCFYYFFMVVGIVRYETTATACWALLFIVRAFSNDPVTVAVWTCFHVRLMGMLPPALHPRTCAPGVCGGQAFRSDGHYYIRWCFADAELAAAFASEFGA